MEDIPKLSISLVFDEEANNWISKLAEKASSEKKAQYVSGVESIPHLTIVQAIFPEIKPNGKKGKRLPDKIEEAIRSHRLLSEVPDLMVSSKQTWTSTSDSGVFCGLHVHNDTMLQQLHNKCVAIIHEYGGEVTSAHGFSFMPHITLALLEHGQQPNDIFEHIKRDKVLHAPHLVVGKSLKGGALVEVFTQVPTLEARKVNRNTDLGR